jgi:RNA polymerase sigma-70 factor (ECF subfamily)
VNRAIDGDERAFAALYRAHADAAFRLLTRLVGPIAERDDLLQETFVRLHRVLPRFEHR